MNAIRGLSLVCLMGHTILVHAQDANVPARTTTENSDKRPEARAFFSTTRRFVASGFHPDDAISVARWAEEVADRVAAVVEKPLPFYRDMPLEIRASLRPEQDRGRVLKAQGFVDGLLHQRLLIINPQFIDQEDVLEGLCSLLLDRYVAARQTPQQLAEDVHTVPDWLSVGVAQNLYRDLRDRNTNLVLVRWRRGDGQSFNDLLRVAYLPDGRWIEKAYACLAVGWIISSSSASSGFDAIFEQLSQGKPIDGEWVTSHVMKLPSSRELEKGWDLWIASQQDVRQGWGQVSDEKILNFKRLLIIEPGDYALQASPATRPMTLSDLTEQWKKPWLVELTGVLSLKMKQLSIGEPPEFREVINRYTDFLDALAKRATHTGGLFQHGPSKANLRRMLRDADQALARYEADRLKQRSYLDDMTQKLGERAGAAASGWPGEHDAGDAASRAAWEHYIDKVEKRLPARP